MILNPPACRRVRGSFRMRFGLLAFVSAVSPSLSLSPFSLPPSPPPLHASKAVTPSARPTPSTRTVRPARLRAVREGVALASRLEPSYSLKSVHVLGVAVRTMITMYSTLGRVTRVESAGHLTSFRGVFVQSNLQIASCESLPLP